MIRFICVLFIALCLVSSSFAQQCRKLVGFNTYNTFSNVGYNTFANAGYSTVGYNYNLHNQNVLLVPKAFFVETSKDFYLGVSDEYRRDDFAERVASKYFAMVQAYAAAQKQQGFDPMAANVPPLTAKTKTGIGAVLQNKCVSCHASGMSSPILDIDPDLISQEVRLKCYFSVSTDEMPKKGDKVTDAELREFGLWVKKKPTGTAPAVVVPPVVPPVPKPKPDESVPPLIPDMPKAINEKKK